MEIKICGITRPSEAAYLNENKVDYAGFVVFFEKSKRFIEIDKVKDIFKDLSPEIKKVAVTVSPTVEQVKQIEDAGFDILQVHKELSEDVINVTTLPVWYAVNISDHDILEVINPFFEKLTKTQQDKIKGFVVDGAEYGSGKTFDWAKSKRLKKAGAQSPPVFEGRKFILAGGLNPSNVAEGIELFEPDMVDVSSGVEGSNGKDPELVKSFVSAARGI